MGACMHACVHARVRMKAESQLLSRGIGGRRVQRRKKRAREWPAAVRPTITHMYLEGARGSSPWTGVYEV